MDGNQQPGPRSGRREVERCEDRDRLGGDGLSGGGLARSLQVEPTRVRAAGRRQQVAVGRTTKAYGASPNHANSIRLACTSRGTVDVMFVLAINWIGPVASCDRSNFLYL